MNSRFFGSRCGFLLGTTLVLSAVLLTSCVKEYDLDRPQYERGTLGEELHALWLRDTERAAVRSEERTALLLERREEFVGAVDRAVPPGEVAKLDRFLTGVVPAVQAGYFPALTRRVAQLMEEALEDEELMASLDEGALYGPGDYLAPLKQGRFVSTMGGYPDAAALMAFVATELAERDGLNEHGERDLSVSPAFSDLLRALSDVAEKEPPLEGADSWAATFRDLLVVPDARFRTGEGARNTFVALFDDRGRPLVRRNSQGQVPAPFLDSNGDGLADLDEEGRFLLQGAAPMAIAPLGTEAVDHPMLERFVDGRVLLPGGQNAFHYVDLTDTALPFLVRIIGGLATEGAFYHLASVAMELFGPGVASEDDRGPYVGFSRDHPLVDILDAVISGLAISELPEVMELTARYIDRRADDLAFLSYTLGEVRDLIADQPGASISPTQTLIFDILAVVRELTADPELWADVMEALRDPIMERAGEAMGTLLRHSDTEAVPAHGGPYDSCFQSCKQSHTIGTDRRFDCIRSCPNGEIFSRLTDFNAPESEENRSMFQRVFHLLRDTAGVEYRMEVVEAQVPGGIDLASMPPMIVLPGAAEAFVRAVAGELHMADYVSPEFMIPGLVEGGTVAGVLSIASELFGARLDVMPTPDQITRLFNEPDLRYEEDDILIDVANPRCHDGYVMAEHHADGLYAAEASGLIDVLYPLARAFARHEREDLLTRLFVIVHDHYSSHDDLYLDINGVPSPMKGANLVSLEPALEVIFEQGQIFEALRRMALSTRNINDDHGVSVDERLRQLIHKWVRNDESYETMSGQTALLLPDGRELEPLSRLEVIVDRAGKMAERVEDDQATTEHLVGAVEAFFDVVLKAEMQGAEAQFSEAGTVALLTHGLRYLAKRARQMEARGEFQPWLTEDVPRTMKEVFVSRGFFAAVQLIEALHQDEAGERLLAGMLQYFADDVHRADQMALMAYGLMVMAMDFESLTPVGRFILRALDPDRAQSVEPYRALPNSTILARVVAMASEADEENFGVALIGRASRSGESYDASFSVLADIILRYMSSTPTAEGTLNREARETAIRGLSAWVLDSHRGMERYFKLAEKARRE